LDSAFGAAFGTTVSGVGGGGIFYFLFFIFYFLFTGYLIES
jgi:hypothetical protein